MTDKYRIVFPQNKTEQDAILQHHAMSAHQAAWRLRGASPDVLVADLRSGLNTEPGLVVLADAENKERPGVARILPRGLAAPPQLVFLPYFGPDERESFLRLYASNPRLLKLSPYALYDAVSRAAAGIRLADCLAFTNSAALAQTRQPPKERKTVVPILASGPHSHFQLDLWDISRKPRRGGNVRYVVTLLDIFTKHVWMWPVPNKSSEVVSRTVVATLSREYEISMRWGKKFVVQSDNGSEFAGTFKSMVGQLGRHAHQAHGLPYHAWSQGAVERVQKTIKQLLSALMDLTGETIVAALPLAVDNYNHTRHSATGFTPHELHELTLHPNVDSRRVVNTLRGQRKAERRDAWEDFVKANQIEEGDHVRRLANDSGKAGAATWSDSVYEVRKVSLRKTGRMPVFTLVEILNGAGQCIRGAHPSTETNPMNLLKIPRGKMFLQKKGEGEVMVDETPQERRDNTRTPAPPAGVPTPPPVSQMRGNFYDNEVATLLHLLADDKHVWNPENDRTSAVFLESGVRFAYETAEPAVFAKPIVDLTFWFLLLAAKAMFKKNAELGLHRATALVGIVHARAHYMAFGFDGDTLVVIDSLMKIKAVPSFEESSALGQMRHFWKSGSFFVFGTGLQNGDALCGLHAARTALALYSVLKSGRATLASRGLQGAVLEELERTAGPAARIAENPLPDESHVEYLYRVFNTEAYGEILDRYGYDRIKNKL